MMRWNREAAMLGIPDLPEEGFKHVGDRKIKPQGGSGGGGGGTTYSEGTQYTSAVPPWLESEQKEVVARGLALAEQPYQPYGGERVSQFTPLQRQAYGAAERQQIAPQLGLASGLAGISGVSSFRDPGTAGSFMNPFIEQALAPQLAGVARESAIRGTQQQGEATMRGAFGGSRDAIMRAEREKNLMAEQSAILGRGYAQAFDTAQQQFNAERAAQLAAAGQLGQLGQTQFGQEMGIMGRQRDFGAEQQAQIQRILDQQYADFQAQRDFPYQQVGFASDIIQGRGGSTRQMYAPAQPSNLQTIAGLGTAAAGLSGMFAAGGEVDYADGGITGLLGDRELAQTAQNPSYGPMMQMAAQDQMAENAALRAAAPQGLTAMQPETAGNAEAVLTQKMVEALNRGDKRLAEELAEALEEIKVQQEVGGIAGVMPEQMAEVPEGGIMEMAMGGEVQTFSNGGSPYVRRNEETDALIASPTRSVASTPQMMFGTFDINKARAQEEEALRESGKEAVARQDEALKRHKDFYAGLGALGAEKEQRIREDLAGEEGRKDQAKSMALLQAGLAILSADPSRGGLAAIGEGAGVGLGAYKGDLKDLEKRRERMTDKLDELAMLRRQESMASNEGLERIYARRDQVLDSIATDFRKLGTKYGIDVPMENAKFMAERADRFNIAKIQSDRRTEGERLRDELKQHKPGSPEYNRILQDIEAISIAQNAGKPDTSYLRDPQYKSKVEALALVESQLAIPSVANDPKKRQPLEDRARVLRQELEAMSGGRGSSTSQSSGTLSEEDQALINKYR